MTDSPAGTTVAVTVNGERRDIARGSVVAELAEVAGGDGRGLAVAVDRQVVPRSEWATTAVGAGAVVEVLTAAAGG